MSFWYNVMSFWYNVVLVMLMIGTLGRSLDEQTCKYAVQKDATKMPEIFWINMDKSVNRREMIEKHLNELGHLNTRVKGLSLNDIYIPEDILSTWDKYLSKTQTSEIVPPPDKLIFSKKKPVMRYTHVMLGLVGRGGKNKLKEIGCTSSHLEAMRRAIYFNRSSSRYAVITEDDIQIPFNIDFEAVAASAPAGFGILQLFNSNEESMAGSWSKFIKQGQLWSESFQMQPASFWSTCAYLIDREVMKPIIDRIAYAANGWVNLKIVAGIKRPCRPKFSECCSYQNETMTFAFSHIPPCIWAAKGYQADSFIYALAKTYVLNVPLITNGAGGNMSTFHQEHVLQIHQSAFARQRGYINELISKKYALPSFASVACTEQLPVMMLVNNITTPTTSATTPSANTRGKVNNAKRPPVISTAKPSPPLIKLPAAKY